MRLKHLLTVAVAATMLAGAAQAQQFFRIGTGGTAGTYYPVGGMIANAVSQPGKIIATAQASNGSLANVNGVASGSMEAGFSQSDVATWAYTGTGAFEGKPKVTDLRMIANLYPESIHLVVKKGSGIKSVADLKGKRVALDEPGSGTLIDARMVLAAYGVKESRHQARIHQAEPGRRQAQGRRAGCVLLRRRRPGRRHLRTGLQRHRHRIAAARRPAGRGPAASPAPGSRSTTLPPTPTRTCPRSRPWRWARSW